MIYLIAITALASALAGWGKIRRIYVQLGYAAACGAYCPIGALVSVLFWVLFRTGKQAKTQLAAMDTINHKEKFLAEKATIQLAIPLLFISVVSMTNGASWLIILMPLSSLTIYASLKLCNYSTKLGQFFSWNHGRFMDCRRVTELAIGIPAGCFLYQLINLVNVWISL